MTAVSVLPVAGQVLLDARQGGRALRLNWHDELGLCVLSIWRGDRCAATFQLPRHELPALVTALVQGLAAAPLGSAAEEAGSINSDSTTPAAHWTAPTYSALRGSRLAGLAKNHFARLRIRLPR